MANKTESTASEHSNASPEIKKNADTEVSTFQKTIQSDFQYNRTFSGTDKDTWHDFKKYFKNSAVLNNWSKEQSSRTMLVLPTWSSGDVRSVITNGYSNCLEFTFCSNRAEVYENEYVRQLNRRT